MKKNKKKYFYLVAIRKLNFDNHSGNKFPAVTVQTGEHILGHRYMFVNVSLCHNNGPVSNSTDTETESSRRSVGNNKTSFIELNGLE